MIDLTGDKEFKFHEGFIQLKNRAPHLLWSEICLAIKMNPKVLLEARFYIFAIASVIVPGCILRPLTNFYRHRITRKHVRIIPRGEVPQPDKYTKKGIW